MIKPHRDRHIGRGRQDRRCKAEIVGGAIQAHRLPERTPRNQRRTTVRDTGIAAPASVLVIALKAPITHKIGFTGGQQLAYVTLCIQQRTLLHELKGERLRGLVDGGDADEVDQCQFERPLH